MELEKERKEYIFKLTYLSNSLSFSLTERKGGEGTGSREGWMRDGKGEKRIIKRRKGVLTEGGEGKGSNED